MKLESDLELDDGLDPESAEYVREVANFFLASRGTGLFLTPLDAELILEWHDAQVPLRAILRGINNGAVRLAAKKKPLRSLRRLKRYVNAELRKIRKTSARRGAPGLSSSTPRSTDGASASGRTKSGGMSIDLAPPVGYDKILDAVADQRHMLEQLGQHLEADGTAASAAVVASTLERLETLKQPEQWGAGGPVPAMLRLGRTFYQEVMGTLSQEARNGLYDEAALSIRSMGDAMSERAREETLDELAIGILRARYGVLEPARLLTLWDD